MDKQINLMDLLKLCMRRWWALVIGLVVGGIVSGVFTSFFVTPIYVSATSLYSENTSDTNSTEVDNVSLNTIVTRQTLVQTYAEILTSNVFLKKIADETNLGYAHEDILKMLSMTSKNDTEILVIKVSSPDPNHAFVVAKKIVEHASEQVSRVVEGGSVKLLDEPEYPEKPSSPDVGRNIKLGMVGGLLLSLILVFLVEYLDNKVKSAEQVSETFGYPVLGEIPFYSSGNKVTDISRAEVYYSSDT